MRLFLLRHAHAKDTFPDADRELSEKGVEQIGKLCSSLNPDNFSNIVQIWHSPYLRAVQTAKLFKESMKIDADMIPTSELSPMDNPHRVARMIAAISCFGGDLMIVSHNPILENMLELLLSNRYPSSRAKIKKCALASLMLCQAPSDDAEYGAWALEFLITPSLLR